MLAMVQPGELTAQARPVPPPQTAISSGSGLRPAVPQVTISLRTDKASYSDNEKVRFSGRVITVAGEPVPVVVEIKVIPRLPQMLPGTVRNQLPTMAAPPAAPAAPAPSTPAPRPSEPSENAPSPAPGLPSHLFLTPEYRILVEVKGTEYQNDDFTIQLPQRKNRWESFRQEYLAVARAIPRVPAVKPDVTYAIFAATDYGWNDTVRLFWPPVLGAVLIPVIILYAFTIKPDRRAAKLTLWGVYAFGLLFLSGALLGPLLFAFATDTEAFLRSTPIGLVRATTAQSKDLQWLIHIGGTVSYDNVIHGGFAVPLFVVTLAMVGGVVNMLLQLPTCLDIYYRIALASPAEAVVATFRKDVCNYFVGILAAPFLGLIVYGLLLIASYTNPPALALAALSVGFASNTIVEALLKALGNMLNFKKPGPPNGDGEGLR
jgi:hypothetical protein